MLTWEDLKAQFPPERWASALAGLDEAAFGTRLLDAARAWLAAKLAPCGIETWDEDGDQIVRLALLYRAQYEFYAYFEEESLALDKKETAAELLRGRFGSCVEGTEEETTVFHPYAYVAEGSDNWRGFSDDWRKNGRDQG